MSDPDLHLKQLKAIAATLRCEIATSREALIAELEPINLVQNAARSIVGQVSEQIDPRISRALSSHGTVILALTAAAVSWGIGQRAFAKPRAKDETRAEGGSQLLDRTSNLLALAKEMTALVSMISQALATSQTQTDSARGKEEESP
ncbi:MAG: hypothetical protein KGQ46_03080 [Hyphomicrobiales bacterium]|nr:hypothetical protein [Hyphomicrobiales bacterium]MDE2115407.1 hypothetical protein [Hyphomicrobiales bacterium]